MNLVVYLLVFIYVALFLFDISPSVKYYQLPPWYLKFVLWMRTRKSPKYVFSYSIVDGDALIESKKEVVLGVPDNEGKYAIFSEWQVANKHYTDKTIKHHHTIKLD